MHTMLHIPVHCLSPFDWYMMRFALRVSELCMSIGFCFFPFALFEFYWFWFELNVIKWCIFALLWVYVDGNVKKNASTKYGCAIEKYVCSVVVIFVLVTHTTKEHTENTSKWNKSSATMCSHLKCLQFPFLLIRLNSENVFIFVVISSNKIRSDIGQSFSILFVVLKIPRT